MPVGRKSVRFNFVKQSLLVTALVFVVGLLTSNPRPGGGKAWTGPKFPLPPLNPGTPSPAPSGGDDTKALNSWFNENIGKRSIFRSAPAPYRVEGILEPPLESWIETENNAVCEIVKIGNGDLFRLSGASVIQNIYVRAETEQTVEGSAFDFSHHNCNNIHMEKVKLGSNFFNGFFVVAEKGLPSFGVIKLKDIEFQEPGSLVKGYKGSGFVIGSPSKVEEHRTVGVFADNIYIGVEKTTAMVNGFKIANTDSLHMGKVLVQNAGTGLNIGEKDESLLRTTNSFIKDFQADGCGTGMKLESMVQANQFDGGSCEACTKSGVVIGEFVNGLGMTGFKSYNNAEHGMTVSGAVDFEWMNTFQGCHFTGNGTNGEAGMCGVLCVGNVNAGGYTFNGCHFGNPLLSSKQQKIGLSIGAKCKSIGVFGCRFFANGVGVNYEVGAETENCPANEAALKTNNLVA